MRPDHAVELPAGHGHPQDRSGDRRGLHHGVQARRPDAADLAGPGRDPGEAGLPAGVLNVVSTVEGRPRWWRRGWTADWPARSASPAPPQVGKLLLEQAAEHVMRTSMELGGNAPFIVCEDADLDRAVDGAMVAKMRNMGEACTAANRLFVHRSVADEFAAPAGRTAGRTAGRRRRGAGHRRRAAGGGEGARQGAGTGRRRRRQGCGGGLRRDRGRSGPGTSTRRPSCPA